MRFPKLKYPTLSQFILYMPAFSFFIVIILCGLLSANLDDKLSPLQIVALLLSAVISLWYLIKNVVLLLGSDIIFSSIRCWKKARRWFESDCNGNDLETAHKSLLRRSRKCGKECEPLSIEPKPLVLCHRRSKSYTFFWFAIEKISLVYSVTHLDMETYQSILRSASINAKSVRQPKEKMRTFLMDKHQKKAKVACAVAVVILAEQVDPSVIEGGVKASVGKHGCMIPCVAEIPTGRYYFDSLAEPYIQGMSERPEKNFAVRLMRKLLFGGRLPLRGNKNYVPLDLNDFTEADLELSLWEYIRRVRGLIQEGTREERRIAKKLRHGEVMMKDDVLYCKLKERMAYFVTEAEEKDSKNIRVLMDDHWAQPKTSKISKMNQEELKQRMETYLISNGYRPTFVWENDE